MDASHWRIYHCVDSLWSFGSDIRRSEVNAQDDGCGGCITTVGVIFFGLLGFFLIFLGNSPDSLCELCKVGDLKNVLTVTGAIFVIAAGINIFLGE